MVEGHNTALVDKFDLEHSRRVLEAFGRCYGKLSELPLDLTEDEQLFLAQAVDGLADEKHRVISVQLAVFAEMMRLRPWTVESLVGVRPSLLATFRADTTVFVHRLHAATALAHLGETSNDVTDFLISAIHNAEVEECSNIVSALSSTHPEARSSIKRAIIEAEAEEDWVLKARLAIVLLHMGD